jgi:hypothetical protein
VAARPRGTRGTGGCGAPTRCANDDGRTFPGRSPPFRALPRGSRRKMREGGVSPGPFDAFTRGGGSLAQPTPQPVAGPELHLSDEPLLVCLQPLEAVIGHRSGLSTPATETLSGRDCCQRTVGPVISGKSVLNASSLPASYRSAAVALLEHMLRQRVPDPARCASDQPCRSVHLDLRLT